MAAPIGPGQVVLNTVGFIAGMLGIFGFGGSHLPKPPDAAFTKIRVTAGMGPKDADIPGAAPMIALWDVHGEAIGFKYKAGHIKNGNFKDLEITHFKEVGNGRPDYMKVTAGGHDGLCIAALGLVFPDGDKQAWVGDVGYDCGKWGYPSEMPIGTSGEHPICVWIDGYNDYGNTAHKGFAFHLQDFIGKEGRIEQYNEHKDTMCISPRFETFMQTRWKDPPEVYDPPLQYHTNLSDIDLNAIRRPRKKQAKSLFKDSKRSPDDDRVGNLTGGDNSLGMVRRDTETRERHEWVYDTITLMSTFSAERLCSPDNKFWGPEMYKVEEQLFCDMSTHQVWPICSEATSGTCFDVPGQSLRYDDSGSVSTQGTGTASPAVKTYKYVQDWTKSDEVVEEAAKWKRRSKFW